MTVTTLPVPSVLSVELLSSLRCLNCGSALDADSKGGYVCLKCRAPYPAPGGVARFVPAENYANSFGYQWHRYDRTQIEGEEAVASERYFGRRTGFGPEELRGKLVLDVGCGMGRFADIATRWGARVVGVDLSAAAEVAARNLADRDFVAMQADVLRLPFAPESFDVIYSIGVLHHTPDCEKAFKSLIQYLRPGGVIAVWLYSGYNKWYRFSDIYRRYTSRMSPKTLHSILRVAVPTLYWTDRGLRVVPLIGKPVAGVVHHLLPVNRHPNPEQRLLDTFDWYSPTYQSKHTYEEVFRWLESSGLEDLHVLDQPIAVRGRKPLNA